MAREVRLYGLIYTRIRQSRVYYIRAKRKKRRQRVIRRQRPSSTTGSVTGAAIYLSLSFSSSPYPFSVRPSCERYAPSRMPCHPGEKNNISLWNISNSMIATFIYIAGRCVGWWRVARCASSLFLVSSSFVPPLPRLLPYTSAGIYTRIYTPVYYYYVRREESGRATPDRGVYYAARDASRRWAREIRADKRRRWRRCRRPVASPFHHGFCYKIL